MEHMETKKPDKNLWGCIHPERRHWESIRRDGWELRHIPEEYRSPDLCREALENCGDRIRDTLELLYYVPHPEICLDCLQMYYGCTDMDLPEMLSALAPGVADEKIADFVVEHDGRCLGRLPGHLQTEERAKKAVEQAGASALLYGDVLPELKTSGLWLKCAAHSRDSCAQIPPEERSPEVCLAAYLSYPGMVREHPSFVPQPVRENCNVYSLCRLMEQMTGGKFTYGQMADFYGGKPMAVKCIEVPDGFLKDREVTFDRQKETFRIAPLSQRQEQKQQERQEPERNDAPKRRNGMKI